MLVGETTDASLSTRTISKAIATDAQSVQLLYATAAFVSVTTSLMTCLIAKATLNTVVPSFVLTATAALSAAAWPGRAADRPQATSAAITSASSRRFMASAPYGVVVVDCRCRNSRLDGDRRRRGRVARSRRRLRGLRSRSSVASRSSRSWSTRRVVVLSVRRCWGAGAVGCELRAARRRARLGAPASVAGRPAGRRARTAARPPWIVPCSPGWIGR